MRKLSMIALLAISLASCTSKPNTLRTNTGLRSKLNDSFIMYHNQYYHVEKVNSIYDIQAERVLYRILLYNGISNDTVYFNKSWYYKVEYNDDTNKAYMYYGTNTSNDTIRLFISNDGAIIK